MNLAGVAKPTPDVSVPPEQALEDANIYPRYHLNDASGRTIALPTITGITIPWEDSNQYTAVH